MPLAKTVAYHFIPPSGHNIMVLMSSFGGDNQEDSMIMSQQAIDSGLFSVAYYKTEILQGSTVVVYAKEGDYLMDKHVLGLIDNKRILYRGAHCVVDAVWDTKNYTTGEKRVVIKLRYHRPPQVGDKFSVLSGNKCILASILRTSEMPYTKDGIVPDMIINPHSIPSRMTIGQLIEANGSQQCSRRGIHYDSTAFNAPQSFFEDDDKTELMNPETGKPMGSALNMNVIFVQRLQKHVADAFYARSECEMNINTGQPLRGKSSNGGLRMGYMELWSLESHGSQIILQEKCFKHSDQAKTSLVFQQYLRAMGISLSLSDF